MNKLTKAVSLSTLAIALAGSVAFTIASNAKGSIIKEYDEFGGEIIKHLTDEEIANNIRFEPFYTPSDQYYSTQKSRSMSNVGNIETVWDNYKGDGTVVAVIDSGIEYRHPDFYFNPNDYSTCKILKESAYFYSGGYSTVSRKIVGEARNTLGEQTAWNVLNHDWDSDYKEWEAHGTNVASSAAGAANGVGTVGIAPNAKILALKIDFYLNSIDEAIRYAVDQGVDVINMSLGAYAETFLDGYGDQQEGSSSTATELSSAINYAYNHDVIVIAAAGNEKTDHYSYPACNNHVIGVGALAQNSGTSKADFSNYNKSTDTATGNHNVDLSAPGYVYCANEGGTQANPSHTAYCDTQGTSFSSPIVAGAACLYKEKFPNATPDEFETALYNSCVDIGTTGWDKTFGYGRLDVGTLMAGDIAVTGISMSSSAETIYVNSTMEGKNKVQLTATLAPQNPTNKNITWTSSNTSVATVNNTGLVTAVSAGSTTITARSQDGNFTATCAITVQPWVSVTGITICDNEGGSSKTIHKNETIQLTAEILPSNATWKEYIFESENANIATVSNSGLVRGTGIGTTNIVAWAEDGDLMDEYTVTVEAVTGSSVLLFNFYNASKLTSTNGTGASGQYLNNSGTLNGNSLDNTFVTGYDSNSTTVQYDKSGGLTLGSGSKKGTLRFSIPEDYTICDVTIVGTSWDSGATFTINDLSASSGSLGAKGAAIANVTTSLLFSQIGGHTFDINTTGGNRATIYTMEVTLAGGSSTNVPVTGVSIKNHENIDVSSLTLDIDDTEQLNAVIEPSNATDKAVTWASSNASVASVSSNGLVTALSAGSTTISATTHDGNKTDSVNVTVNAIQDSVTINPTAEVEVGSTTTISATASGSVTWTTVNGTGSVSLSNQSNTGVTITGVTAGSATVIATCGTATANCAVTVTSSSSGGTEVDVQYKFTSKDWAATLNGTAKNWTKGKSGNGYSNNGIQVTTGTSGANGTCKENYSNIVKVTISYCTNSSNGKGTITASVGSTSASDSVTTSGGTTARNMVLEFPTQVTGNVNITVSCTTNSIYICGCTITYIDGSSSGGDDPITVTGVTVSPTSLTLDANGNGNSKTGQLTATLQTTGTEGTINTNINWTTGNSSVATVSNSGLVTAVGIGNTTITATSAQDGTKFASCAVTVTANTRELVSIEITTAPTKTTYVEGDLFDPTGAVVTATYSYAPLTENVTSQVTWTPTSALTTSDTKAYASFGGKSANVDITVTTAGPITSGYEKITSLAELTDGQYVIAGIDDGARMAFVNTFSNSNNYSEVAPVNGVISEQDATGFNISITRSGSGYLLSNGSKWLTASTTTSFATSNNVDDASEFTIECVNGLFKIYSGSRGIMYRSGYGFKNYATSNYTAQGYSMLELYKSVSGGQQTTHVTGITLDQTALTLKESATQTLVATVLPADADNKTVTWSSSDSGVATVTQTGLVTAIAEGTTTITVTSNDVNTISASCVVTVTKASGGDDPVTITATFNLTQGTSSSQLVGTPTTSSAQWEADGVTLSIDKANSSTNVNQGVTSGHTRFYQNSVTTITAPAGSAITNIEFTMSESKYVSPLTSSTFSEGCSVSSSNLIVTVDVPDKNTVTITAGAQFRATYINVTYKTSGASPEASAIAWATSFNNELTCDATGNSAPSKTVWNSQATSFDALSSEAKAIIVNATYSVGGNGNTVTPGTDVDQQIANAVSKYDYIINKYGASEYTNFMGRSIASNKLGNVIIDNSSYVILVSIPLLIGTTFGGFLLKKKKVNSK